MSKRLLRVAVPAAALVLALTACGGKQVPGGSAGSAGGSGGGDQPTVAFVPKLVGIPYFEAMKAGGEEAAKKLGVKFLYQGDTTADAAKQAEIVNSLIQQKVDVLAVAPNDPSAIAPVLKRAADAGIKVMTTDTDAPDSVRSVFVNQAESDAVGEATADALAEQMGGKGKWAIVSSGPTAANLNAWIKVEKAYIAKKYPDMKFVDVKYAGEDQAAATQLTKDLISANPDLKGVIGQSSTAAPGVAQAITDLKLIGKVYSAGVATPKPMANYIKSGAQSKVVLWDAKNLGYLTVWAGQQLAQGKQLQASNDVGDPVGTVTFDSATKNLLLGKPITFTKDNVDQYNF
jgi:rhamnose transport system substrate-binding protein